MPESVVEETTKTERPAILFIKGSLIGYQDKVQVKFDLLSESVQAHLFWSDPEDPDAEVVLPLALTNFYTGDGSTNRDDSSIYLIEVADPVILNDIFDSDTLITSSISGGVWVENYEDDTYVNPRLYQLPVALTHVRYIVHTITATFNDGTGDADPDGEVIERVTTYDGVDYIWVNPGMAYSISDDGSNYVFFMHLGPGAPYDASFGFEAGSTLYEFNYGDFLADQIAKTVNPGDPHDTDTDDEDAETVYVVRGAKWTFTDQPEPSDEDIPPEESPSEITNTTIIALGLWKKED